MNKALIAMSIAFVLLGAAYALRDWNSCKPEFTDQEIYDGFKLCMQSAGTTRCSMTAQDFILYWHIKGKGEIEE
jgi:hypothetical protein